MKTKITKECPFCKGTLTPMYNGNTSRMTILYWECSNRECQFGYNGDNAQDGITAKNLKIIEAMQSKIAELQVDAKKWQG